MSKPIKRGSNWNCWIPLFTILLLLQMGCHSETPVKTAGDGPTFDTAYVRARSLSKDDAIKLEEKLKSEPGDEMSRAVLISYYKSPSDENAYLTGDEHILWLIKNKPDSDVLSFPDSDIVPGLDPQGYKEGKAFYLKHLETDPKNIKIIANASSFLFHEDTSLSDSLIEQARKLDPTNYIWSNRLAFSYYLQLRKLSGEERKQMGQKSLNEYETAMNLAPEENLSRRFLRSLLQERLSAKERHRFRFLDDAAKSAIEAGDLNKARTYALELLDLGARNKTDSDYSDSTHQGNTILGRIALRQGNISDAEDYLLKSAKVKGSPVLHSFGPSMYLASELLDRNERDVVIEYLHLCANFWTYHKDYLDEWESDIRAGKRPDFGLSLDR